jgi:hypothetical protein
MPIPKHLQHFYRSKQYKLWRVRLLDRAGNACEQCHAPNHARIFRLDRKDWRGWWWSDQGTCHDPHAHIHRELEMFAMFDADPLIEFRAVKIVLTAAHLNHTPGDDRDENGKMLCQRCHLNYDFGHHKISRITRKDAARPLLVGVA